MPRYGGKLKIKLIESYAFRYGLGKGMVGYVC